VVDTDGAGGERMAKELADEHRAAAIAGEADISREADGERYLRVAGVYYVSGCARHCRRARWQPR
jgi:hypothetical protein